MPSLFSPLWSEGYCIKNYHQIGTDIFKNIFFFIMGEAELKLYVGSGFQEFFLTNIVVLIFKYAGKMDILTKF